MKDRIALRDEILAYLKAARAGVPSRDLAARFLAIPRADDATCRRLLAPILAGARGLEHREGAGWIFAGATGGGDDPTPGGDAGVAAAAGGEAGAVGGESGATEPATPLPAAAIPADEEGAETLARLDVIALATDGIGPGGSGAPRAVAIVPWVGGEALHDECFPAGGLDEDGGWVGEADAGLDARPRPAGFSSADLEAIAETAGDLPIVAHRVSREVEPLRRAAALAGVPFHPRVISVARLGHLIGGLKANHLLAELAALLGVPADGPDDCRGRARLLARVWEALVPALAEHGVLTLGGLLEFQEMASPPVDFARYAFTAEDLRLLPASPGVYRFLDADGGTIYIGKAKSLRSRVGSYFVPSARRTPKGRAILERVRRLEIELAASELEAILLEADLLLRERPPINRQFEVSERPAPYGPRQNLVVVLKDDEPASSCTLHLVRGGRYLRRLACDEDPHAGGPRWSGIDAAVRTAYFEPLRDGEGGELDWFLLGSFLRRHLGSLNVLDVDECADARDAAARLRVLYAAARAGQGGVTAR